MRPLVSMATNRVTVGKTVLSHNEDMHKSLNEFEIRPDATTGFHGNHRVIIGKMLSAFYRLHF